MNKRIYLSIPYSEKEEVKSNGAKWDPKLKSWYIPEGVNLNDFQKWYLTINDIKANEYFIAETVIDCWKCKKRIPVFSIFLNEYYSLDTEDLERDWVWDKIEQPSFVSYIRFIDKQAAKHMENISEGYVNMDYSKMMGNGYLMNHCPFCEMKQGDFSLFEDNPGVGFCVSTLEQLNKMKFYQIKESITLSGQTYMSF
ncbi:MULTISPECIES: DUF5710 domain-containing protein [Bacillota]|uniref:DUF5710 domain-containing protein n=1 Tax=Bacillota TaxID=1239 RepID=UPI000F4486DC|nr:MULTISPECIES: DUF5710 domain-containing protein [Bacillota]AYV74030.1 hypothetical protein C2H98_22050 [Niallia circulans]NRG30230.1 hypothetical protein [Niallia circulans]